MASLCNFKEEEGGQNHLSTENVMRAVLWVTEGCTVCDFLLRKEIISTFHYILMSRHCDIRVMTSAYGKTSFFITIMYALTLYM
jgi:hypothetical protein